MNFACMPASFCIHRQQIYQEGFADLKQRLKKRQKEKKMADLHRVCVKGTLLITSLGQVGLLLPISVRFPGIRKTGCWLTCHYVAVVLKRLIRSLKFLLIFRGLIQREWHTERRPTPLSPTGWWNEEQRLSHVDSSRRHFYDAGPPRTPLSRWVFDFCAVILERTARAVRWNRGTHFVPAQPFCLHIILKQVMNTWDLL